MPAAFGFVLGVEAEVDERVVRERGAHEDVAAVAAVAAGGAAAGDEFSRRKAMQPLPPSPALMRILASSMNMGAPCSSVAGGEGTGCGAQA